MRQSADPRSPTGAACTFGARSLHAERTRDVVLWPGGRCMRLRRACTAKAEGWPSRGELGVVSSGARDVRSIGHGTIGRITRSAKAPCRCRARAWDGCIIGARPRRAFGSAGIQDARLPAEGGPLRGGGAEVARHVVRTGGWAAASRLPVEAWRFAADRERRPAARVAFNRCSVRSRAGSITRLTTIKARRIAAHRERRSTARVAVGCEPSVQRVRDIDVNAG